MKRETVYTAGMVTSRRTRTMKTNLKYRFRTDTHARQCNKRCFFRHRNAIVIPHGNIDLHFTTFPSYGDCDFNGIQNTGAGDFFGNTSDEHVEVFHTIMYHNFYTRSEFITIYNLYTMCVRALTFYPATRIKISLYFTVVSQLARDIRRIQHIKMLGK